MAQDTAKRTQKKPLLADASGSESGLDYFAQGGVVLDGVGYFTADQSCSKYWKGERFPFGVAFDVHTFRKIRTYPFKDTYDSCPLVIQRRDGTWVMIAHEYKEQRTVAFNRDTAELAWASPANQPGAYFFGYSYFVRPDGSKLVFAAAQNGLHAVSAEDGREVWWLKAKATGGVTPCVDQKKGWVFYQADGRMMKISAEDGALLKSVEVRRPCTVVSWNTVLVNESHGYYVATYWFDFLAEDGKTRKMEWNSAIRVYDAELNLAWERTALPAAKKSTLTYADGKLVVGTGGHWGAKYTGVEWKYLAAYSIERGDVVWKCDLSKQEYDAIINAPYAYGCFYAEAWGKTTKLFRINAKSGVLEEALDYKAPANSCAPCLIACGKLLSGDLVRDGVLVTALAENSTAEWPGPFCDPQTNTYALPEEPKARLVPMKEIRAQARMIAAGPGQGGATPRPAGNLMNLAQEARVFVTDASNEPGSKVEHMTDGNPATYWHGPAQSLPDMPANILILFAKPETITKVTVTTQVFKNTLRLRSFELFARAGQDWAGAAPLAVVKDSEDLRVGCAFEPVTTDGVRLRLKDTWRSDHAYPRICEIEIERAAPAAKGRELLAAPIPDETEYERAMCEWAMGVRREYPGGTFDPEKGYLYYAQSFVDTMLAKGTDVYGNARSPMFVSILMIPNQKHPNHLLPCIPGQRAGDRAPYGGNLHHDVMLLQAMDLISEATGDPKYRNAAESYLDFFLRNCPSKETGLFPWGEHAHWDFYKDAPGHNTHEYLGAIPVSFWERLWRLNRAAVIGEADGLMNHVVDLDTFAWNRHADIQKPLPEPRPKGLRAADFPRHSGFYIRLWSFVYAKTGERKYLDWSLRAIDHHWRLKRAPLNLPPMTAGGNQANMESAFSLAISLLQSAPLLPKGKEREHYEEVANTYLDAIARMPHKPVEGYFLTGCKLDAAPSEATGPTVPWSSAYGGKFTADDALLCCAAYRLTGKEAFLRMAKDAAEFYSKHEPPPPSEIVQAQVYAAILTLFLDLHDQTGGPEYLAQAKRYAKLAIERLYCNGLFRGATGINYYESQLMVGNLIYALVWLHVKDKGLGLKVEPDYFDG